MKKSKKIIIVAVLVVSIVILIAVLIKTFYDNAIIVFPTSTENIISNTWEPIGDNPTATSWKIEHVSMKIKEPTLTNKSVIVILTDTNPIPVSYGEIFGIDKKSNNEWKPLDLKKSLFGNTDWDEGAQMVEKDRTLEMFLDIEKHYGVLKKGEYRIVKEISNNGTIEYLYTEFTI